MRSSLFDGSVVPIPIQSKVSVAIRDKDGNLYLGGTRSDVLLGILAPPDINQIARHNSGNRRLDSSPNYVLSLDGAGAFVAKLSPDGSTVIFDTLLSAASSDSVTALALAPDGTILATGLTRGGLAVTPDAASPSSNVSNASTGFFARLNSSGQILYASYLNGTSPFGLDSALAMTVDSAGAAYITGPGSFDSTPGALASTENTTGTHYFIVKLDSRGKQVWATGAVGGKVIALDAQGSIYIAAAGGGDDLPVTPDAYQPSVVSNTCLGYGFESFSCNYQYVAKLNATASQLIFGTWLSGAYGATPNSLVVDSTGNVFLAGTTQSTDYPITPNAYETANFATQPIPSEPSIGPGIASFDYPYTGYVTKLNTDGTALVFSTYIGGSVEDTIQSITLDTDENVYLAGFATSPDFPGLSGVPHGCEPNYIYSQPFVTRLSADGSSLTKTTVAFGIFNPLLFSEPQGGPLLVDGQGNMIALVNGSLASFNLFDTPPTLACAIDAADGAPLAQIAPGQLITLMGAGIGTASPENPLAVNGIIPSSSSGGGQITIDGIPSPILYSSPNQVNVQVPYEVAGGKSVKLEINTPSGETIALPEFGVTALQPSSFPNGSLVECGASFASPFQTLALNPDGTVNSCSNPAPQGSVVTVFLNGLGSAAAPDLVTGAIAANSQIPAALPIIVTGDAQFVSASSYAGSINGVWALKLRLAAQGNPAQITVIVGDVSVREPLAVWVEQQ